MNQSIVKNWSESVSFSPEEIVYPDSIHQIIEIVKLANEQNRKIRVMGSKHSFTPLISSTDLLLSLDRLQGVISIDKGKQIADIWAGTKLSILGEELAKQGYAQENLGDINVQSLAGAFLTGTHGTGTNFGILSTQLEEVTIILGIGELITCSRDKNADLFHAIGVSFGLLGIVVKMKIRVIPLATYQYESTKIVVEELIINLEELKTTNKHFEFYLFPYAKEVQIKIMNETIKERKSLKWEKWKVSTLENNLFFLLSEMVRVFPNLSRFVSRISAKSVPNSTMVGYSHELFATERKVKFNEMEYNIPKEFIVEAFTRIQDVIEKQNIKVHFPIECRFVKSDQFWLSPANGRDSAYIAVHMYKGMPYEHYFKEVENILQEYEGRPHWGKMHTLTFESVKKLYPKLVDFLMIREKIDPNQVFVNDYFSNLFQLNYESQKN